MRKTEMENAAGMNVSTESRDYPRRPLCITAATALSIAVVALSLAILGIYNPWVPLRFPFDPAKAEGSGFVRAVCFIAPIGLGIVAALVGGYAFRVIERARTPMRGDGFAFFSIMIGLFAAIIGVCTTFVVLVWPVLQVGS